MKTRRWMGITTMVFLLLGAAFTVQAQMGQHMDEAPMDRQRDKAGGMMQMDEKAMGERCGAMMQRMQKMRQRMQEMDQALQKQVEAMERAAGDDKVEAMEQVVLTLAEQRQQMREKRQQMMQRMMKHMGEHAMMGGDEKQKRAMMMRCPMMQSDQDEGRVEPESADPDHESHH